MNNNTAKITFGSTLIMYLLIGFEFFYMAGPFAAYFYSVYKPALSFIDNYPAISWLTGFFLPHIVEDTQSQLLNAIPPIGGTLAVLGMLCFGICAFQIYYSKLFKKKVVTGGIYKFIRHPQYTAFAISSFGILLLWPRFLALIMFVTVLFGYYFLAKVEEKECTRKFGEDYQNYLNKTGMFFPRIKNVRFFGKKTFATKHHRIYAPLALYLFTIFVTVFGAIYLKQYAISQLYQFETEKSKYVSVFKKSESHFKDLITVSELNLQVDSLLNDHSAYMCYALPADMYISEIPMQQPEILTSHVTNKTYNTRVSKLIYTLGKSLLNETVDAGKLSNILSLKPVLEVWVDTRENKVIKVVQLKATQRYQNISEPVF